jgi:hypothetical protein
MWFTLGEAIYNTGQESGVGSGISPLWFYIVCVVYLVICIYFLQKKKNFVIKLSLVFAFFCFFMVWIQPGLGGGEAELGISYFILVFIGVPAGLLGTSFEKIKEFTR